MSPLTVRPKIYHQEQYNNDNLSPKDSSPSGGILRADINTVREVASSIINHPVTKAVSAIAITLLVSWGTNKVFNALTKESVQSTFPSVQEDQIQIPKDKDTMESSWFLGSLVGRIKRDKDPVGPQTPNGCPCAPDNHGGYQGRDGPFSR
jgi:hypothetical protein